MQNTQARLGFPSEGFNSLCAEKWGGTATLLGPPSPPGSPCFGCLHLIPAAHTEEKQKVPPPPPACVPAPSTTAPRDLPGSCCSSPALQPACPHLGQDKGCSGCLSGDTPGELQHGTEAGSLRQSTASSSSPARVYCHVQEEKKHKEVQKAPQGSKFELYAAFIQYPGKLRCRIQLRPALPQSHPTQEGPKGSQCSRIPALKLQPPLPSSPPRAPRQAGVPHTAPWGTLHVPPAVHTPSAHSRRACCP